MMSSHLAKIGNAPRRSLKFNMILVKPNDVIIYLAIAIARSIVLSTKSSEGIHGIWGCSTQQYSRQLLIPHGKGSWGKPACIISLTVLQSAKAGNA
jgi:hypothetical protein